jgi:hypothetical protein
VLGRCARLERLCAPQATSPSAAGPGTVDGMGDIREQACVGRGDGTDCPNGEVFDTGTDGPRCEECRHHWELDETERGRRMREDDGLTRPLGDPGEAGRGSAA